MPTPRLLSLTAILILAGVVYSSGGVRGQVPVPKNIAAELQGHLDKQQEAGRFPGASLAIVLRDGTEYALASGLADKNEKTPLRPQDRLMQGSIGKTYVSAIAMQLIAEERLDLAAHVSHWLGEEPWFDRLPNSAAITIHHLMNHTSGLVRYEFNDRFLTDLNAAPDRVWQPQELVSYLLDTEAPFVPGEGWDYSDTNYIVLGMVIERITGASYYEQLQARVLDPLDLRDTVPTTSRSVPGLVQGYAGENNPFGGCDEVIQAGQFVINPQFEWTGGGLASTTIDLARWGKLLYEGKAFDPKLLATLLDGVPARLGRDVKYGLGVILRDTRLGPSYGHSGYFPGYLSEMIYFPEHELAVALQTNSSQVRQVGDLRGLAVELAEIALGQ